MSNLIGAKDVDLLDVYLCAIAKAEIQKILAEREKTKTNQKNSKKTDKALILN